MRAVRYDIVPSALQAFLEGKGWKLISAERKGVVEWMAPGRGRNAPRVLVPLNAQSPGADVLLDGAIKLLAVLEGVDERELIAEIGRQTSTPASQLSASLKDEDTLAVRLMGRDYDGGTAPFSHFEAVLQRLRGLLQDGANFVITDDPAAPRTMRDASRYVDRCRFLQTDVGSFVARIRLPSSGLLRDQGSLFDSPRLTATEVNKTVRATVSHVFSEVLPETSPRHLPKIFEANRENVSIGMLSQLRKLLHSSNASMVGVTFSGVGVSEEVQTPTLEGAVFDRFDRYLRLASDALRLTFGVSLTGEIVELRSRYSDRRRNLIGVACEWEGRLVHVSVQLKPADYADALEAHKKARHVKLIGQARRLRTQLRIERLETFQVL